MAHASSLKFCPTDTGYRLRIEGRGTMQESGQAEAFVDEALTSPQSTVVVDLSAANYLDSTFLGCLLGMYRRYGTPRFRVSAPKDVTHVLFGPTKLDVVLHVSEEAPPVVGDYVTLGPQAMKPKELARHIAECHRRLADVPCPQQAQFAEIARQMSDELKQ